MKKNKTKGLFASIVLGVAVTACAPASSSGTVTVVDRPDIQSVNTNYIGYRAPLRPLNFIKLPVGSIQPEGWVKKYLELQRDGLTGHLGEISAWLEKDNNAWLTTGGDHGWEEVPYWLKGSTFMTTGEIVPVEGTPMDFRTPTPVGERINDYDFVQLKNGNGYDHNWVLNTKGDVTRKCASLKSPKTGIVLDVYTNEPGIQVYAGNFLDGSLTGKKGITYNQRASVCLETQKYPDTPNKAEWPSAVLRPGEKYTSQCIFKFSVDK